MGQPSVVKGEISPQTYKQIVKDQYGAAPIEAFTAGSLAKVNEEETPAVEEPDKAVNLNSRSS